MSLFILLLISSFAFLLDEGKSTFSYQPDYRKDYSCQAIDHHLASRSSSMTDDLDNLPTLKQTLLSCSYTIQPKKNTSSIDFYGLIQKIKQKDKTWSFYINKDLNRSYPKVKSQFIEQMRQSGFDLKEAVEAENKKDAYLDSSDNVLYLFYEDSHFRVAYK